MKYLLVFLIAVVTGKQQCRVPTICGDGRAATWLDIPESLDGTSEAYATKTELEITDAKIDHVRNSFRDFIGTIEAIDECKRNDCGEHADCIDGLLTYECRCKVGYVGDGYNCTVLNCIIGNGDHYRGPISVTENGLECQRWDKQSPHGHSRTPSGYPNGGLENNNNCRNPDKESRTWCYTVDPSVRWEYCDIPAC